MKMVFDRTKINFLPLQMRESKISIEKINCDPCFLQQETDSRIEKIAKGIIESRENGRPVIIAFGAHLIRNGLGPLLKKLVEKNYITHLATNGAGSIHDWEFAFQGKTTEDVREYLEKGQFGIWEETGKYINLALISGAVREKGYGEAISEMINTGKLILPEKVYKNSILEKKLNGQGITSGGINVKHPFKEYSLQNAAFENSVPFTVHPCFGQDIIYAHPLSDGASIGKTAEIDFLRFVNSVSNLEGGCYISIGSAIMSPMIFEKALSMSRNVARQEGKEIKNFMIVVNDIQKGNWEWGTGIEPPKDDPAYYLRFCKTFSRAGAREMHYIQADNRSFLSQLYYFLENGK
jgi:hypothetical protein